MMIDLRVERLYFVLQGEILDKMFDWKRNTCTTGGSYIFTTRISSYESMTNVEWIPN